MVIPSFAMDAVQPASDVFSFNQEDDRLYRETRVLPKRGVHYHEVVLGG